MLIEEEGRSRRNPWVIIRKQMWEQVYKGAACFGMTPADLAGVRAVEKPPADKGKSKFFDRNTG
jgi:phage terminase small subunit